MIGKIRLPKMNELEQLKEKERITVRVDLKVFRTDTPIHDEFIRPEPAIMRIDKINPRLPHRGLRGV